MNRPYTPQLGRQFAFEAARRQGIDPNIFLNQLNQESGFRNDAVSSAGARGPGQFLPSTWQDPGYGLNFQGSIDDPYANIDAAAQYHRALLEQNGGDPVRALAAYNWGQGNVQNWNGDLASAPAETQGYIKNILGKRPSAMSLFDTLEQPAPSEDRNRPVTAMDPPEEKKEARLTFHPGMALSSLGAALAASAEGENAAEDLDGIRARYFQEREAIEARAAEERARMAAIQMVGQDSEWGQALSQGADPQMVMQDYARVQGQIHAQQMQSAGFGHDRNMAALGNQYQLGQMGAQYGYDSQSREDSQAHDLMTMGIDQGFQREMQGDRFSYESSESEKQRNWQAGESAVDRNWRTGERLSGEDFQRGESALDRSQRQQELDLQAARDKEEVRRFELQFAQTLEEASKADSTGANVQDILAEQLEEIGDTAGAARIRASNPATFSDPAMVNQITEIVAQGDVEKGLSEAATYVNLLETDPEKAKAYALSRGFRQETVTDSNTPKVGSLTTDYGYLEKPDGSVEAYVIPGSATDVEQKAKAADAARAAQSAASDTTAKAVNVLDALGEAKANVGFLSTGLVGQVLSPLGGTSAYDVRASVKTATANIAFDRLQAMREASPTGGALGSVTEGELDLLASTLASLDANQSQDQFLSNIEQVEKIYRGILQKVQNSDASPADKKAALEALGMSDNSAGGTAAVSDDDLINKYLE